MIQTVNHLLPAHEAKELAEWLRQPASRTYRKFLALEAARLTAEAGNQLVSASVEGEVVLAKDKAAEARTMRGFRDLLDEHSAVDYKFNVADLNAQYSTT